MATLREIEGEADSVGLPLTGEEWGERLLIKKKGGGYHFDEEQRANATVCCSLLPEIPSPEPFVIRRHIHATPGITCKLRMKRVIT